MKLAVLNSDGIQVLENDIIKKYYIVKSDYDFISNNATDVTSITNLLIFYTEHLIDYKSFRNTSMGFATDVDEFNALSDYEKEIIVSNWAHPSGVDITTYYPTDIEQKPIYLNMINKSLQARHLRVNILISNLAWYYKDTPTNGSLLFLDAEQLQTKYLQAALPHLDLFMNSGTYDPLGIDYSTTGYASKSYYDINVLNSYNDIINDGYYDKI